MIGATVGAILATPVTPKPSSVGVLRVLQAVAIVVAIFTITEATHLTAVTRSNAHYAQWSAWWQILLVGCAVGAATQGARLTGGTLLVPALYFLTAIPEGPGLRTLAASACLPAIFKRSPPRSSLPADSPYGCARRQSKA